MSQTQIPSQTNPREYVFYRQADTSEILVKFYDIHHFAEIAELKSHVYEIQCRNCIWENGRIARLCHRHEIVKDIMVSEVLSAEYDPITKSIKVVMWSPCESRHTYLYVARYSITAYRQFIAFRYRYHSEMHRDSFRLIMKRLLDDEKFSKVVDKMDFIYEWMDDDKIAPESPLIYCDKGPLLSLLDIVDRMGIEIDANKIKLFESTRKYDHNLTVYILSENVVIDVDISGIRDFKGKITNDYIEVNNVRYDLVKLPAGEPFKPKEIVDAILAKIGYEFLWNLTSQQQKQQQ